MTQQLRCLFQASACQCRACCACTSLRRACKVLPEQAQRARGAERQGGGHGGEAARDAAARTVPRGGLVCVPGLHTCNPFMTGMRHWQPLPLSRACLEIFVCCCLLRDSPSCVSLAADRMQISSSCNRMHGHAPCRVLPPHQAKPPHGAAFKRWAAAAAAAMPDVPVTTCHSYDIHVPFRWQCTNAGCAPCTYQLGGKRHVVFHAGSAMTCRCASMKHARRCPRQWCRRHLSSQLARDGAVTGSRASVHALVSGAQCRMISCPPCGRCGQVYARHSNSIDCGRQACGRCSSALAFLGRFAPDGTPARRRAPTAFSAFVRDEFAGVKASMPGTPHREVLTQLLRSWLLSPVPVLALVVPYMPEAVKALSQCRESKCMP